MADDRGDEEKDAILCELFTCLSMLGDLRKQYDQLVSEGYIQLSKARYNLGVSAVGSLQYPNNMAPVVGLNVSDDDQVHIVPMTEDCEDNDELDLRKRRGSTKKEKTENRLGKADPLCWFSGLPPQSLRMSQQHFKKSIEIVVELANTQAKIFELQKKLANKEIEVIASMSKQ